ncbi:hypothetical protein PBI_SCTP2_254 [Salicola phage SCTP-2]|nr:hypothetical protein PBI_SCTP2_254 [Salicola phage SCTP-2]
MGLYTILSLIGTAITIGSFLYYIIRKLFKIYNHLETKLSQIENKIKVHPLYELNCDIIVQDFNGNIKNMSKGDVVRIKSVEDGFAYFESKDGLLSGKAPSDSFKTLESRTSSYERN